MYNEKGTDDLEDQNLQRLRTCNEDCNVILLLTNHEKVMIPIF
jgi:hypothetical protein